MSLSWAAGVHCSPQTKGSLHLSSRETTQSLGLLLIKNNDKLCPLSFLSFIPICYNERF